MEYKQKGLCLEYHRSKNNYSINELITKEYKICDHKAYQKVVNGECEIDEIYEDLYKKNRIYFGREKNIDSAFARVIDILYDALQYMRIEEYEKDIIKILESFCIDECLYPYTIFNDFIAFYSYKIEGSMEKVELYKSCLNLFSYKLQVFFYEYYYQSCFLNMYICIIFI